MKKFSRFAIISIVCCIFIYGYQNMEPEIMKLRPLEELREEKKNALFEQQKKKIEYILKREELKNKINS